MKPILYSYFRSSASYRVRIALHLKEIEYDYHAIHLLKDGGQQNALNYKAVNPMGQVPTLVDGMNVIAQSMAIIDYIDQKWPTKHQLFPKDMETKAQVIEFCEIINSGIQPLVNLKIRQTLEKEFKATEEQTKQWLHMFMHQGFEAMEKKLAKHAGTYCFGNQVTAADVFLVPAMFSAVGTALPMDKYPLIKKVNDNLLKLEPIKKAHPQNTPDYPQEN